MTKTMEELETELDELIAEMLNRVTSPEQATDVLMNIAASPALCLIAAALKQGQPNAVAGILNTVTKAYLKSLTAVFSMHKDGSFEAVEKGFKQ